MLNPVLKPVLGRSLLPPNLRTGGGIPPLHSWFSDGGDGLLYDVTKTDRFFQEATGPSLAYDIGESIGLALDQSKSDDRGIINRIAQSEGLASTYPIRNGVTDAALAGFDNAIQFGDNSGSGRWVYKQLDVVAGVTYTVSAFIVMDDGGLPVSITSSSDALGDFGIVINNSVPASATVTLVQGNLYRAFHSLWVPSTASLRNFGVVKYSANTARGFRVAGIQVEAGSAPSAYQKTNLNVGGPGNHSSQATGSFKPQRQASGAKFDGADDNLLSTYLAGSGANSIVALVTVPATISATQIIAGAQDASSANRCWIGVRTSGVMGLGYGTTNTDVGNDMRGTETVVALSCDGATLKAFQGTAEVYSSALGGVPTTATPIRLGGLNNNGAAASFFGGSIKKIMCLRKAITFADYLKIRAAMLAN